MGVGQGQGGGGGGAGGSRPSCPGRQPRRASCWLLWMGPWQLGGGGGGGGAALAVAGVGGLGGGRRWREER